MLTPLSLCGACGGLRSLCGMFYLQYFMYCSALIAVKLVPVGIAMKLVKQHQRSRRRISP